MSDQIPAWPGAPAPLALCAATPVSPPPLPFERAAIAGGSPQALGLAVALARAGAQVTLIEDDSHDARRAHDALTRAQALHGIVITTDPGAARGAPLAFEASGLDTPDRAARVATLGLAAGPGALLATLGAVRDLNALAGAAPDPARFIALDTAAPPPAIDLLEIVPAPHGSEATVAAAHALAAALGAEAVVTPGFIGAALLARLEDAAEALVFDGSSPWEVDAAAEGFGFALGPCAAQDLRGLDIAYARHRAQDAAGTRRHPLPVLDRMVPEGRLGRKGGVGWYRYPGGGGRVIDPLIEDLAREEAHFAHHPTRTIPDDDIRQRLLLSLIDTACTLTGTPDTAIDRVSLHALGFPHGQRGLMTFARRLGFSHAVRMMDRIAAHEGLYWSPSPALRARAAKPPEPEPRT